jgi:hypothetical protein
MFKVVTIFVVWLLVALIVTFLYWLSRVYVSTQLITAIFVMMLIIAGVMMTFFILFTE